MQSKQFNKYLKVGENTNMLMKKKGEKTWEKEFLEFCKE